VLIDIGHDLQRVSEIEAAEALLEPDLFFTAAEIAHFARATNRGETVAGAFCAKEALFKALPKISGWFWTDAEIHRDTRHAPALRFHNALADHMAARNAVASLSISHSGGFASAVVVVAAPSPN
jgi:holo-[acyl-carrier protein] synthase